MATPWTDVIQSPAYQALPPDQQEAARQQYFAQVVAPQLADDDARAQAKRQFDAKYGPQNTPFGQGVQKAVQEAQAEDNAPPSLASQLGRASLRTAKAVGEGVGGTLDALTAPIAYGLNKILPDRYQIPSNVQALDTAYQKLTGSDLAPQNAAERYSDAIARGVGGALTGVGVGNALATSARPVVSNIGSLLASNPGAQVAATTTGSALAQSAKDAGYGEGAQLAAGLGGSLIPGAVAGAGNLANTLLVRPLTSSGRQELRANYLGNIAGGSPITVTPSSVPGVQPTLAEASANPGIAQLQRALANQPENVADFANLSAQNNAARQAYLTQHVGTPEDIVEAQQARDIATKPLYQAALAQPIQATQSLTDLTKRPAIAQAIDMARDVLANRGQIGADPLSSVGGLQLVKLQLDRMVNAAPGDPIGRFGRAAVQDARSDFMDEVNNLSPQFKQANEAYAQASKKPTSMQVGQAIVSKGSGNLIDPNTGLPMLQPNAFQSALNRGDKIAQQVTGQKNASLGSTLSQSQQEALSNVASDLNRVAYAQNAGRAVGSNTGQNILSSNALDAISNAIGIPGLANSTLAKAIVKPLDKIYNLFGVADDLKAGLTRVMLDPTSAESAQVLSKIPASQRQQIIRRATPYINAARQAQNVVTSQQVSSGP